MTTLTVGNLPDAKDEAATAYAMSLQRTLAGMVKLSGRGLHSGGESDVTIYPAGADTGIVFRDSSCAIRGHVSNVVDTSRGTTLGSNGSRVRTIEHLMAALRGRGIDNAVVEVTGSEMPALDGSALPYVEAMDAVGMVELEAPRKYITLPEPVAVQQNGSFILAVPAQRLRITYVMSYDHPLIGSQSSTFSLDEDDFVREFAPARTFVLYEEVAKLLDNDLARGGSFENAIVVWQDRMSSRLRFPDELVRHKVMDLVGDLSLIGGILLADIVAVKSGHALNVEFARQVGKLQSEACGLPTL